MFSNKDDFPSSNPINTYLFSLVIVSVAVVLRDIIIYFKLSYSFFDVFGCRFVTLAVTCLLEQVWRETSPGDMVVSCLPPDRFPLA